MLIYKLTDNTDKGLLRCLSVATDADAVLLTQDAVYALMQNDYAEALREFPGKLFALHDDLLTRGVRCPVPDVKAITYEEMVDLSLTYTHMVSW